MELRNVGKRYSVGDQAITVLDGINLIIRDGEYVSIVGPSGSGKSTMMHILGCLDAPSEGEYWLNDWPIHRLTGSVLSNLRNGEIGFVFQNFFLLPRMTALQNVELPLAYAGVARAERRVRAMECLCEVGLEERVHHRPNALSGGQRQRVAIARALANRPKVLLADEPTGALDSQTGREILTLFQSLNQQGVTLVVITHDSVVARAGKRIVSIYDGRIVADNIV